MVVSGQRESEQPSQTMMDIRIALKACATHLPRELRTYEFWETVRWLGVGRSSGSDVPCSRPMQHWSLMHSSVRSLDMPVSQSFRGRLPIAIKHTLANGHLKR